MNWSTSLLRKAFVLVIALCLAPIAAAAAEPSGHSTMSVTALRTDYATDPIGLENTRPTLSWLLEATGRNQVQRAYQIRAAESRQSLSRGAADRWDTGKVVSSTSAGVGYAGRALRSRDQVWWQVRVWDGKDRVSPWSGPARFEMGLLTAEDWTARWITHPDWQVPEPRPVVVNVPPTDARFVRVEVTKLGPPLKEGFPQPVSRLQLAETEVHDSAVPTVNLARGAAVSASESYEVPGAWEARFLTDGTLTTEQSSRGYTSYERGDPVLTEPIWLRLDLGSVRHFDRIVLYPRTDAVTESGATAGFPVDFAIRAGNLPDGPYAGGVAVTGQEPPPPYHRSPAAMPVFARHFTVGKPVRAARLYATGLGVHETTINGEAVSDAVLEPANTDYRQRVEYATYDVTGLLLNGANAIGVQLGNGLYHVPETPGRYQKLVRSDGLPKMLAQLEITYADGTRSVVAGDESWRTTLGGTTFSSWYGGEDFDARRLAPGWDLPAADLTGWQAAVPQEPAPALSARSAPPVKVMETIRAKAITEPRPGIHVVDFGVNFAGWPELRVAGPAGTTVTMRPSELLNPDGTADQRTTGSPIYDRFTLAGTGNETWHPRFGYHGFRYLQLEGLPSPPSADTVTGLALRAANESAGTFDSSNLLLNQVHTIIDRAIQSNMYSVLTDCPHREKLGWLEQTHLVFGSVARNYDVAAYYRSLVRTMADAQTADGLVPDIAPEYAVFDGPYRDDPNWGGALVLAPLQLYRTYGDAETLRTYYPNMVRYLDFLRGKANGGLLDYGLGDWGTFDPSTPLGVTSTFAYHRLAEGMAEIAGALGESADVVRWRSLAGDIGAAFNAKYLDPVRHTYATGSQASDALALDMGVVPAEQRQAVTGHLVGAIETAGHHLTVGEVALPSVLRVLSAAGRDDVIYQVATQTGNPSYGYQVVHGATSLTENWDGPTSGNSQNHFMLGAIDEWFTAGLAGIKPAPGTTGYHALEIKPAVVGELARASGSYRSPYGTVSSSWSRRGARVVLAVTVPVNTTAIVQVPGTAATSDEGVRPVRTENGYRVFEVGSGHWSFRGSG